MSDGKKQLSTTDWATIITLWERGESTLQEMEKTFGITRQAISQGLKKRGIVRGSRLPEVAKEIDDAAAEARAEKVKKAGLLQEQYAKYNDAIVKILMKRVVEGAQTPGGIINAHPEIRALKDAVATLAKAREEQWTISQIEDYLSETEDLPDLNVGEYTPEEIEAIRQANEESYLETQDDDDDMSLDIDIDDEDDE